MGLVMSVERCASMKFGRVRPPGNWSAMITDCTNVQPRNVPPPAEPEAHRFVAGSVSAADVD
jgi:hypothetical protein